MARSPLSTGHPPCSFCFLRCQHVRHLLRNISHHGTPCQLPGRNRDLCGLAAFRRASRLGDSWPPLLPPISNVCALAPKGDMSSPRPSLVLRTDPLQELPCRHRRDATDRAAEIAGNVPAERPLPEQSHEVACRQHHRERDQQSLPKRHGTLPAIFQSWPCMSFTSPVHKNDDADRQGKPGRRTERGRGGTRADGARAAAGSVQAVSITGSRPTSRASWRSRTKTRSPASAFMLLSKRSTNRPRSTTIGVFGSTPVVEAETR